MTSRWECAIYCDYCGALSKISRTDLDHGKNTHAKLDEVCRDAACQDGWVMASYPKTGKRVDMCPDCVHDPEKVLGSLTDQ